MRIAVCDDEEFYRNKISEILLEYAKKTDEEFEIRYFKDGKNLLEQIMEIQSFDIIFLDVDMKIIDGMSTAKQIRNHSEKVEIVFVTAYIKYSLDGYRYNAIRYILKDEQLRDSLIECMDAVMEKFLEKKQEMIFEFKEGKQSINIHNISYIESRLHDLAFHVIVGESRKVYILREKLDEIEKKITGKWFCRVHKSYLVNLEFVHSIERYKIRFEDGDVIAIARVRFTQVQEKFLKYIGGM